MKKPNLLFLYTDEQAFNTMAAYGNSRIDMPNLNRLARESVVFDEAYVTQPVCTPSRSTLLTGLYPHANGCTENNVPLKPETLCLPEMLTGDEYITAHFGKWHLGDELYAQHGFREWLSIEDGYNGYFTVGRDRSDRSDYHHWLVGQGFSPRDSQYEPEQVTMPPNFEALPGPEQPLKTRLLQRHYERNGHSGLSLSSECDWRRMIANYWGLCSLVDTHVGRILDVLDDCGLTDNTIVVFTSDHGDMMGAHGLIAKCVMYQEAIRVQLMVRLPGRTPAKRIKGPVSQIDVVPTLLDLMNQAIPTYLQGKSLRPWFESGERAREDPVFVEWNGPDNGIGGDVKGAVRVPDWMKEMATAEEASAACSDPVRTIINPDGWKFNCSPLGEHELYNVREDPQETRNVFGRERTRARELREQIVRWQKETGDEVPLPEI
ncbi:MAG: sulfatase-like hydrolase/transferase [Kiritimatiellia bacterium]